MNLGARRNDRVDGWLAPGTALCFSILVAILAPHYTAWFGDALPAFTRWLLAGYPPWVGLMAIGLIVQTCANVLQPQRSTEGYWRLFDGCLAIASVLIIAAGLIARALPKVLVPAI